MPVNMQIYVHRIISIFVICITSVFAYGQLSNNQLIEVQLDSILNNQIPKDLLVVEYTDLHGLWGGEQIIIKGDGSVYHKAVRIEVEEIQDLTVDQINELLTLLIELQLWQQVTPYRNPNPDESKAFLRISIGDDQSEIWEWFNDLDKNNRIIQVVNLLKSDR
jgi:hypothetical protein